MTQISFDHILITGGAEGIGRSVVERLVHACEKIIVLDKNTEGLKQLKNKFGDQIITYEVDLLDISQRKQIFSKCSLLRQIDLVIVNAGVGGINPGENFDESLNRILPSQCTFVIFDQ